MKKLASLLAAAGVVLLAGAGCAPTNNAPMNTPANGAYSTTGRAVVAITDAAPTMPDLKSVVVTVDKVEIHNETSGWTTLSAAAKTYDLLMLKNESVMKVLADATVDAGTYEQVRLDISKVEVTTTDGKTATATLPSNELKIVGNFTVDAGQTSTAVLDFDLDKSLHLTGNGVYILAPVVKLQTTEHADVNEGSDETVEVEDGDVETEETVGEDENGEVKEDFELPEELDVDAEGNVKIHED